MTVILILLTVTLFMTLDYIFVASMRARLHAAHRCEPTPVPIAAEPVWVGGYQLPEDLRYHPTRVGAPARRRHRGRRYGRLCAPPGRQREGNGAARVGATLAAGQPAFRIVADGNGSDLVARLPVKCSK